MKQNHFMLSYFIFWSFSVQCSAQTDNLFSVEISCNYIYLTRFQARSTLHPSDFTKYRALPFFPWIFRFGVDVDGWSGSQMVSAFGVIEIDLLFIASYNLVQKLFFLLPSKQNFADDFLPFNVSWFQFI